MGPLALCHVVEHIMTQPTVDFVAVGVVSGLQTREPCTTFISVKLRSAVKYTRRVRSYGTDQHQKAKQPTSVIGRVIGQRHQSPGGSRVCVWGNEGHDTDPVAYYSPSDGKRIMLSETDADGLISLGDVFKQLWKLPSFALEPVYRNTTPPPPTCHPVLDVPTDDRCMTSVRGGWNNSKALGRQGYCDMNVDTGGMGVVIAEGQVCPHGTGEEKYVVMTSIHTCLSSVINIRRTFPKH